MVFSPVGREKDAPVGIRTRVEASKGPHDWPLHHRSMLLFNQVAPRGFEPLSLAPKASMIDHYTTGLTIIFSVIAPGLELSYITFSRL